MKSKKMSGAFCPHVFDYSVCSSLALESSWKRGTKPTFKVKQPVAVIDGTTWKKTDCIMVLENVENDMMEEVLFPMRY